MHLTHFLAALWAGSALTVHAGFDINPVVTHLGKFDQIDLYFLNKDAGGMYIDPFSPTGSNLFGAVLQFHLEGGHRAYFAVRQVEFGDRVDFPNAMN